MITRIKMVGLKRHGYIAYDLEELVDPEVLAVYLLRVSMGRGKDRFLVTNGEGWHWVGRGGDKIGLSTKVELTKLDHGHIKNAIERFHEAGEPELGLRCD